MPTRNHKIFWAHIGAGDVRSAGNVRSAGPSIRRLSPGFDGLSHHCALMSCIVHVWRFAQKPVGMPDCNRRIQHRQKRGYPKARKIALLRDGRSKGRHSTREFFVWAPIAYFALPTIVHLKNKRFATRQKITVQQVRRFAESCKVVFDHGFVYIQVVVVPSLVPTHNGGSLTWACYCGTCYCGACYCTGAL